MNDVGCAIMMKDSTIDILKDKVLVGERGNTANSSDERNKKKRRTGSGNAAVDTEFGATAFRALTSSERRDTRQNKQTSDNTARIWPPKSCSWRKVLPYWKTGRNELRGRSRLQTSCGKNNNQQVSRSQRRDKTM
jgi:hypothetical protein